MSDFGKFHKIDNETLHKILHGVHVDICRNTLPRIQRALIILHGLEVKSYGEERKQLKIYIAEFEKLREMIEPIWQYAGEIRYMITHEEGCDGNCSGGE